MSPKGLPDDFPEFAKAFRGESDRAAAVLGSAYLDVQLEQLFKQRLAASFPEDLLGPRGALGSFGARIDVAFALAWISSTTRNDLNVIRKIRNDFAHAPNHALSFETPSVCALTANLKTPTNFAEMILAHFRSEFGQVGAIGDYFHSHSTISRWRFEVAFAFLRGQLIHEIAIGARAVEKIDRVRVKDLLKSG